MPNRKNLKPWPPGVSGNPKGKPKGAKHLSAWIQEVLEDETFAYKLTSGKIITGAPIRAIVRVLVIRALQGDMKAFDLLGKYGYGTRHDVTTDDQAITLDFNAGANRYVTHKQSKRR